jgi:hypothetical protein
MTRNSIALARLRRSYVWSAVARNLLLLPLYVFVKGQAARTGLKAVREGLTMSLDGKAR